MIIKALTRRSSGPGQLVKYIFRYIHAEKKQAGQPQFIIRHNIRSRNIEGYINEFKLNELNRIHKRTDQTILNHFILSFSPENSAHITDKTLKSITKKFIQLRGENNLYCGTKHLDKDHVHLHIACSGTSLNGLSARISKKDLANLKVELDKYQKEHFPELVNSLPAHGRQKTLKGPELLLKQGWSKDRQTHKQMLAKVLNEAFAKSKSAEEFLTELRLQGHEPYYRAGKLTGVKFKGDRKFRFNSIGFDTEKISDLDALQSKENKELIELRNLRGRSKALTQEKETGCRERSFEDDKINDAQKEDAGIDKIPGYFPTEIEGFGIFPSRRISQSGYISPDGNANLAL